eukprot:871488_1
MNRNFAIIACVLYLIFKFSELANATEVNDLPSREYSPEHVVGENDTYTKVPSMSERSQYVDDRLSTSSLPKFPSHDESTNEVNYAPTDDFDRNAYRNSVRQDHQKHRSCLFAGTYTPVYSRSERDDRLSTSTLPKIPSHDESTNEVNYAPTDDFDRNAYRNSVRQDHQKHRSCLFAGTYTPVYSRSERDDRLSTSTLPKIPSHDESTNEVNYAPTDSNFDRNAYRSPVQKHLTYLFAGTQIPGSAPARKEDLSKLSVVVPNSESTREFQQNERRNSIQVDRPVMHDREKSTSYKGDPAPRVSPPCDSESGNATPSPNANADHADVVDDYYSSISILKPNFDVVKYLDGDGDGDRPSISSSRNFLIQGEPNRPLQTLNLPPMHFRSDPLSPNYDKLNYSTPSAESCDTSPSPDSNRVYLRNTRYQQTNTRDVSTTIKVDDNNSHSSTRAASTSNPNIFLSPNTYSNPDSFTRTTMNGDSTGSPPKVHDFMFIGLNQYNNDQNAQFRTTKQNVSGPFVSSGHADAMKTTEIEPTYALFNDQTDSNVIYPHVTNKKFTPDESKTPAFMFKTENKEEANPNGATNYNDDNGILRLADEEDSDRKKVEFIWAGNAYTSPAKVITSPKEHSPGLSWIGGYMSSGADPNNHYSSTGNAEANHDEKSFSSTSDTELEFMASARKDNLLAISLTADRRTAKLEWNEMDSIYFVLHVETKDGETMINRPLPSGTPVVLGVEKFALDIGCYYVSIRLSGPKNTYLGYANVRIGDDYELNSSTSSLPHAENIEEIDIHSEDMKFDENEPLNEDFTDIISSPSMSESEGPETRRKYQKTLNSKQYRGCKCSVL